MDNYHGGDIYDKDIRWDFSVNINPLGMPESMKQAALRGVCSSAAYPDVDQSKLRSRFAEKLQVPEETLFFGNGVAELLMTVAQASSPEVAVIPVPSFQEYERAAAAVKAEIRWVGLAEEKDFVLGEEELQEIRKIGREEHRPVSVLLGNPNNPTGQCVPGEIMKKLVEACEEDGFRLVIDESFLPFLSNEKEWTLLRNAAVSENVVVLRSMTKIYGMPGLRAGYLVSGDPNLHKRMEERTQPWRLSLPAQCAMEEAAGEEDWAAKTRAYIESERAYLSNELPKGPVQKIVSGKAPFFLMKTERTDLKEILLKQGILIRDCRNFRGLPGNYVRIAIRNHEENARFLEAWRSIT